MKNLWAMAAGCVLVALVGCGGKVVVDGTAGSSGGQGGSGSTSSSASGGACMPAPAMDDAVIMVCLGPGPADGCAEDQLADKVSMLQQPCPGDALCMCRFNFVSAPCPP